ncbi:hypothetical protein CBR_g44522 [Chara braunii]|uniref:Chromo domain-containing protein n=1 Tax=Chara braunii TaxID=69332 RepID=A0A388LXM7_CHABU|nr:hypothetical protein CBR_g44522 [Chara braunii]|eukprot:GBG87066.1 hypothetical protein CBR_g44522 [Chara braunii]
MFYSVTVMDLFRYDPLCPEVELIFLEPDPPDPSSIFAAPISTSTCQPADTPSTSQASAPSTVESTHTSRADADAEELTRFTTDLESAIRDLIREYHDVFPPYFSYSGIPPMHGVEHSIQLVPDYLVHHQASYPLSIPEATELKRQLEELLRLGFIKPKDQPKTAFRSRFGHYEFTVMPFSLTNAPATFQTAINDIFTDILEEYVLVYLDDILVYSRTLEDHLRHLRDVLQRLRKHDFYAKLNKCRFAQRKVDFLGHHVSDQGLHMDDAKITATVDAREVADIVFDRVVRDHGLPQSIISDRDPRFTSTFWRRLHEVYGSQLRFSSSYHPQTDGQTEVTNKTLGNILRKFVRDDQQWDLHLAHTEIAYNHAVSPAMWMSPFYCDLGYHPRVPADFLRPSRLRPDTRCPALDDWIAHMAAIMKRAHESLADSQTRMAARANRSRMDHPFKVGDDVLVDARHLQLEADTLRKFRRRFVGPCRILQAVGSDTAASPVSFRVKLPDYLRQARVHDVYHVSLLRPYRRLSERFAGCPYERPPPHMVDGQEEFVVSNIVSRRVTDDTPPRIEYLVHWKGYPDEEATWEPLEHLQHVRMLVRAYDRARRAETSASTQLTDPLPPPPAEEIAEDEPAPSEAVPQPQTVASSTTHSSSPFALR